MGGEKDNPKDKRQAKNDDLIWPVLLSLAAENSDTLSFSAREIVRRLGRENSATLITRDRGGITNWFLNERAHLILSLNNLVAEEMNNIGEISLNFCRNLGFLVVAYYGIFAYDIVTHSHRNVELVIDELSPLLKEDSALFFGVEFYQMLSDWYYQDGFTRESVLYKYASRIRELFLAYQIKRPDMSVTHSLSISPERRKTTIEHARGEHE